MAATVRMSVEERNRLAKATPNPIEKDTWYWMKPYWYKYNQHGTWEMYDAEELTHAESKGRFHKSYQKEVNNMRVRFEK